MLTNLFLLVLLEVELFSLSSSRDFRPVYLSSLRALGAWRRIFFLAPPVAEEEDSGPGFPGKDYLNA